MHVADFPDLSRYVGQDLITTDGSTLLGADDKAGVAEIMALADYLLSHPEIRHGTIKIGFTPDEEVGCGADLFDVAGFGADVAYTVDGGELGELQRGIRQGSHPRFQHPPRFLQGQDEECHPDGHGIPVHASRL